MGPESVDCDWVKDAVVLDGEFAWEERCVSWSRLGVGHTVKADWVQSSVAYPNPHNLKHRLAGRFIWMEQQTSKRQLLFEQSGDFETTLFELCRSHCINPVTHPKLEVQLSGAPTGNFAAFWCTVLSQVEKNCCVFLFRMYETEGRLSNSVKNEPMQVGK